MKIMPRLAGLAGLLAATACSSSTGPDRAGFDAGKVEAGLSAVEQVAGSPVLRSFDALGAAISGSQSTAPGGTDRWLAAVRTVAGIVRPEVNAALVPIIRSQALGRTFSYDPESGRYLVDPSRPGAPANGVRFILYQLDPGGQPTASEIGYVELTDEQAASPATAGLRLRVVSGPTTYLDYAFTLAGTIATATVTVDGYLSDGTERVNFDITTTGQLFARSGPVTVDARLEVPSQQFVVTAAVTGDAGGSGAGSYALAVRSGTDQLTLDATMTATAVDATVKVNGNLFATATGPRDTPTIRGEGGRELSAEELTALGHVVVFAGKVLEMFGGLLEPVGVLLLIGLGL